MSIIGETITAKITLPEPTAPYVKTILNENGDIIYIKPIGITKLWTNMFENLSLATINLKESNSYTSIGYRCFAANNGLYTFVIPNSCTSIGTNAFAFCQNLTLLDIGTGVSSIPSYMCAGATSLSTIILRRTASVVSLTSTSTSSQSPFKNCPLEHIYVPASLLNTYLTHNYWKEYSSIISTIPEGV